MGGLTPVLPPPIPSIDLRRPPLLARKTTWAAVGVALLVGGAFWAGSRGLQRPTPVPAPSAIAPAPRPLPKPETIDLAVQSNPSGAEVFVAGEDESLGKTPFRRRFEYREDKSTFLVFRLPGYRELTHEVRPDWSGLVVLDPLPVQPPPDIKPASGGKATKGGSLTRSGHRKNRQPGKEVDPFDGGGKDGTGRTGGRANPF
jgi:hypothetical protein